MVIFRENSEDIYTGVEYQAGTPEADKLIDILQRIWSHQNPFPRKLRIGIKPSEEGTKRLVRKTLQYAIDNDLPSVTLVHKGNIMKFTEGAFKDLRAAREELAQPSLTAARCAMKNPKTGNNIVIKDVIAGMLQQILLRPAEYSAIATLN